jgi:lipopolysaccharide/colanic/teichoic acid biosynthesis glycosyltransferase
MNNDDIRGVSTDTLIESNSPGPGSKDGAGELALRRGPKTGAPTKAGPIRYRTYLGKRLFDIFGALAICLVALPLFVVLAVAIRLTGLPVMFSHIRVGHGRRTFRCYKFRSMVPNAPEVLKDLLGKDYRALQEWRENHKLRDDPRITRLGRFLRETSLDELPQLWNVIKGDMSLVGPRPIVVDELERYGNKALDYCSVRPGMTGLWQVSGRSNLTYSRRVSLDMLYIRKQNLVLDFWVLWRTIFVVFGRGGSY